MSTFTETLIPGSWRRTAAHRALVDSVLVVAGSVLMALSAQLTFYLPFTPVPVTGQTFGVLLLGAALGSRRGAAAMAVYLAEGAVGLPVFSGGACCLPWLVGPTAGYLWSYPLAAFVVGALAERGWDRHPFRAGMAMVAGNVVIYTIGLPWLAAHVGTPRVLEAGLLPFIPGDMIKIVLAALALPGAWALVRALGVAPRDPRGRGD